MTIRVEVTNPHEHSAQELAPVIAMLQAASGQPVMLAMNAKPEEVKEAVRDLEVATPAPAPAPSPTPAAETPAATGEGLDSKGLPWDARIHSSGKTQLADGSWRKKGGVSAEVTAQVEAELRQLLANAGNAPAPSAAPAPAPAPGATAAVSTTETQVTPSAAAPAPAPSVSAPSPAPAPQVSAPAPAPAPAPQASTPAPAPAVAAGPNISDVFQKMTDLQGRELLDEGRMAWFLQQLNIETPVQLTTLANTNPQIIVTAMEKLAQLEA